MKNISFSPLRLKLIPVLAFLLNLVISGTAAAQDSSVAKLYSLQGTVEHKLAGKGDNDWQSADKDTLFKIGDSVRTRDDSRAAILLTDGVMIRLDSNSYMDFNEKDFRSKATGIFLNLKAGKAYFLSREPKEFPTINTPTVTTAIRGTELTVEVSAGQTVVSVFDGNVTCSNDLGEVQLVKGEMAVTEANKAPVKSILVNPINAVQWAINYPALFDLNSQEGERIKTSKDGEAAYEAARRLSAGQPGEADKILSSPALANASPEIRSLAAAQRAVVALAKNDSEGAGKFSSLSCFADPSSSACALSASYVAQAEFRLNDARNLIEKAYKAAPHNRILKVRLAELELSFGEVEDAFELVKDTGADDSYALSILGFVYLFKNQSDEAVESFKKAIRADNTSGLAQLGLGLALIKQGDLEGGRLEITKAVHLEPNVAQYRSYLGKAFFEEERENLAAREYERAIDLDPKDPTPYLYRAFNRLSGNRPVEALEDVEKSIELNNNRSVYRSSLMLDKDLGVKSAGLAEVFTSLGFNEAARTEAIKSINRDYTNYSAHRMLSDSYTTILTDDAARAERNIAILLSPLSFNLFRDRASDGAEASINDYSALFDRPEHRTQFRLDALSQDDFLNSAISQAGQTEQFGYFLSYENIYSKGSKSGDYVRLNRFDAALQYQPGYADRFVLTGAAFNNKNHREVSSDRETELENYDASLGYTHSFGPGSKLIFLADYSEDRNRAMGLTEDTILLTEIFQGETFFSEDFAIFDETARDKLRSERVTMQYVLDTEPASFIFGAQYYNADIDRREASLILQDDLDVFTGLDLTFPSRGDNNLDSQDYYTYTTWHLGEMFDLNLGLNYTSVELEENYITPFVDQTYKRHRLNPKFGLTGYLTETTTLKAAYFESLRKSALEDNEGIEPTLVGGINQRFTDLAGVRARNYGVGFDQKFASKTYFGAEALHRDVIEDLRRVARLDTINYDEETETFGVDVLEPSENHQDQDLLRAYLYQVFSKRFVGTLDYTGSFVSITDPAIDLEIQTHRTKGTVRYFDPAGWFAFSSAEWVQQDRTNGFFLEDGISDFWVCDLGLGYRLPRRHGSLVFRVNNIFDQKFELEQLLGTEEFLQSGTSAGLNFSVNF